MIVASELEYVSSDWVAVEVSAVLVVLPECTWVERLQLARP